MVSFESDVENQVVLDYVWTALQFKRVNAATKKVLEPLKASKRKSVEMASFS